MKYLVMGHVSYEGDTPYSLHETLDDARQAAKTYTTEEGYYDEYYDIIVFRHGKKIGRVSID